MVERTIEFDKNSILLNKNELILYLVKDQYTRK